MKKKIAVFATGWGTDILYNYVSGVVEEFKSDLADIYLFVCNPSLNNQQTYIHGELNIYQLPDMRDFDGALVFANGIDFPEVLVDLNQRCKEAGKPVIYTGNDSMDGYFVGADNVYGTQQLCEHLIDKHDAKKFWFVAGHDGNMDSDSRFHTFKEVLTKHQIEFSDDDAVYSDWVPENAVNFVRAKLEKGEKLPDAIVCANDTLAMVLCLDLEKLGYKVPDDVIITGFDHEYVAQVFSPSICSVDQRFDLVGKECAIMLRDIWNQKEVHMRKLIACEACPGESCGCNDAYDFDRLRRIMGQGKFIDNIGDVFFDRNLSSFEQGVMRACNYEELCNSFKSVYSYVRPFEGDSFHILVDSIFERSIYEQDIQLRQDGYSDMMDVVYSSYKGNSKSYTGFETRQLVPQLIENDSENHLFIFLPLQENGRSMGYVIFCDDIEKLKQTNRLRRYVERTNMVLGKYLRDRRVDILHSRLIDMTRTDALTKVKNRTAYEEREKTLQTSIDSDNNAEFGIALFDVNNLKMFNDQLGHEAGDAYIIASCKLICQVFKHSAVYRIGGDEFVAILEGEDYINREKLITEMTSEMIRLKGEDLLPQDKVSIASGIATYKKESDKFVTDVFKRADGRMYENKITMKSQGW